MAFVLQGLEQHGGKKKSQNNSQHHPCMPSTFNVEESVFMTLATKKGALTASVVTCLQGKVTRHKT